MNFDPEKVKGEMITEVNEKEANGGLKLPREFPLEDEATNYAQELAVSAGGAVALHVGNGNHRAGAYHVNGSLNNGGSVPVSAKHNGIGIKSNQKQGNANEGYEPA